MKRVKQILRLTVLCGVAVLAATGQSHADVIAFDDAYADLGGGGDPNTYYSVSNGLTIEGDYYGVVGGNGNGDPGNWNLEGTNGSAFLGYNGFQFGTGPDFLFDALVSNVSIDIGLIGFNTTYEIDVTSYLDGFLMESFTLALYSPVDPGTWGTVSFSSSLDLIEIRLGQHLSGNPSGAFGVDNIVFDNIDFDDPVPEPASLSLLFMGLTGLAARARKNRKS